MPPPVACGLDAISFSDCTHRRWKRHSRVACIIIFTNDSAGDWLACSLHPKTLRHPAALRHRVPCGAAPPEPGAPALTTHAAAPMPRSMLSPISSYQSLASSPPSLATSSTRFAHATGGVAQPLTACQVHAYPPPTSPGFPGGKFAKQILCVR